MTAATYSRPNTKTATLTAYEANIMDALVRTALQYGTLAVIEDIIEDADNGDTLNLDIAARAPRATSGDTAAYLWNQIMRAAWTARYARLAALEDLD